jgi:glycosyltransferase involved in cell wall biosynthesis
VTRPRWSAGHGPINVTTTEEANPGPRIAVAIPCYNEAAAIGTVIAQFRASLPGAELVVFDNNSTDGTADIARSMGVRVEPVPEQGKGHAVRAVFALLSDRDAVILVDGDGTYPAEVAPLLVAPVLEGTADMVVGARQPERGAGAMSPVRGLGNVLIRSAFRLLIGPGTGDLLSGYRAFSLNYVHAVNLQSEGFEIETELAIEAVTQRLKTLEVSVPYRPRIAGTVSKLNAFRDGRRILKTILVEGARRNPVRIASLYALLWMIVLTQCWRWRLPSGIYLAILVLGFLGLVVIRLSIHRAPERRRETSRTDR